ncbi:hypothetical protein OMP43_17770 [Sphingomonas sp. CBMAI 2297]|uniref:hypothetical protein n=1 Tax=Sphingomonas sp. CBMAI 2297 TaxID=2991720 RepID=UPI002458FD62|nr:hypothetical protein [Sphingomonas sp. CBMAI 2297]MDH4745877.1 hypothetical protein [Sphingomonas sp. CBMAI 2297]
MEWTLIGMLMVSVGFYLHFRSLEASKAAPVAAPPLTLAILRLKRAELADAMAALPQLHFFDRAGATLTEAWQRGRPEEIEPMLVEADQLNRANWAQAGDRFNAAIRTVDQGRTALAAALADAETILRRYRIDPGALAAPASASIEGIARVVSFERHWTQKLDYGAGVTQAATRAMTGQLPWQAVLVTAAGAFIMDQVNRSRRLRQLKDAEGQVARMATAMRGDAEQFSTLIGTRLLPQFDWIIRVLDQLGNLTSDLDQHETVAGPGTAPPEIALRLGLAVAEGRQLIDRKAGN